MRYIRNVNRYVPANKKDMMPLLTQTHITTLCKRSDHIDMRLAEIDIIFQIPYRFN